MLNFDDTQPLPDIAKSESDMADVKPAAVVLLLVAVVCALLFSVLPAGVFK